MSRSFTSIVASEPLRFLITGSITAWDPVSGIMTAWTRDPTAPASGGRD